MEKKMSNSKNHIAWERIFVEHHVLDHVNKQGYYFIDSVDINRFREARLMTKFDHRNNLPAIFMSNNLGILPVSRGRYIIANIELFENKEEVTTDIIHKTFPENIKSIDYNNITSESIAISCSFLSGILQDFTGEEVVPTISGRMKSDEFSFKIANTVNRSMIDVEVNNSQIEIDGGFEGGNQLVLIEAKISLSDTFLIRQLYYPYRLWKNKIRKDIKNIFLEYSNGIFYLSEYKFDDDNNYNSINLIQSKKYEIINKRIDMDAIWQIIKETPLIEEPEIPFPQADDFERVINLLELTFNKGEMIKDEITENYDFDSRQTNYYTDAARYLGLLEKRYENGEIIFRLSATGLQLFRVDLAERQKLLIKAIVKHKVFQLCLDDALRNRLLTNESVVNQMKICSLFNISSDSTFSRRSFTIKSWINWIKSLII
jgi:hypothetical protein